MSLLDLLLAALWLTITAYFLRRYTQHHRTPSLALAALSLNVAALSLSHVVSLAYVKVSALFVGVFFLVSAVRVEVRERKNDRRR